MPSFSKLFLPAGFLLLSCAAGLDPSSLQQKFFSANEKWKLEIEGAKNFAYLVHFNASGPKGKASGSLEIYWFAGDTVILFSPGLFGKGSLRGRWVLGESLLVYFPREKNYYKGSWEDFLLGIKDRAWGLDDLIFGILSRQAFLKGADSSVQSSKNGRWTVLDYFGRWRRSFIFSRRGKLLAVHWWPGSRFALANRPVSVYAHIDQRFTSAPSPKRLEWEYFMQEAKAKFEVDRMVVNAEIPAAKKNFKIPEDAVRLERINVNEEH